MGQALYRKYRSKSLSEIVGQEHITNTLGKALKSGRISHAYLFTGPRGVGKTSIARILAHEINGLPYDENQTHIDIIEIDAASNNGVEDVRDLREKVYVAPTQAKYKVYIIDEVHMLSKQAFNALLKTLEEPPAHVVFILATTEAHKLPETIISRTQRFVFRPIEHAKAVAHLKDIAAKEKIAVTDDALALIAQHGDGSFRDSISLLDQAAGHGSKIDVAAVQALLGIPPVQAVEGVLNTVLNTADVGALISQLNNLFDQGFQAASIAKQLAAALRNAIINQDTAVDAAAASVLLGKLLEVPISHNPERYLEIVLLQTVAADAGSSRVAAAPTTAPATEVAKPTKSKPEPSAAKEDKAPIKDTKQPIHQVPDTIKNAKSKAVKTLAPAADNGTLNDADWQEVLGLLKRQYNTLYGIVRMAKPSFNSDNKLELAFAFAFHQKRAQEAKNLQAISTAITDVTGSKIEIVCVVNPDLKLAEKPVSKAASLPDVPGTSTKAEPLSAISNIFGGGELLQS